MVIGITGGVGAGKSTILNILKDDYSAHLLITDDIAKHLMEPGMESFYLIVRNFGEGILNSDGIIDSPTLSGIVFNNPEKLSLLNSCTHPQVVSYVRNSIKDIYSKNIKALIVIESALLFDCGLNCDCDSIWAVIADSECRLKRLSESRGYSREKTFSVIKNQISDDKLVSLADYVIDNSGDIENTGKQIAAFFINHG